MFCKPGPPAVLYPPGRHHLPLGKGGNDPAPLDPAATTTSLWYASTPKCTPFNWASFLLVLVVIVVVLVSNFLYFPYRSAILTAIPTLVGLLSLRLSTPPLPFSLSTLYHSFPVNAVAVSLLRCPTRDWSPRRDSGYRTRVCTLIRTGGSTVPQARRNLG